jgi:anti-sigma factor RsiW
MICGEARELLLPAQRHRLPADHRGALEAHLAGCPSCAREAGVEALLSDALDRHLPQHAAPLALKRRLAATWPAPHARGPARRRPWPLGSRRLLPALAVAAALALVTVPLSSRQLTVWPRADGSAAPLVAEAINDHLRLLSSPHPLDIESGGAHQVKPWFEGRLDFAPVVRFLGDEELPLRGGAVGYYLDRKAAVFLFQRRLHAVTLLVFRAEGLAWPDRGLERIAGVTAQVATSRGFTAILWREAGLGYALVSDLDPRELRQLAGKLGTAP